MTYSSAPTHTFSQRAYYVFFGITIYLRLVKSIMTLSLFMVTDVVTHDIVLAGIVGCIGALGNALGAVIAVKLYVIAGLSRTIMSSLAIFAISGLYIFRALNQNDHRMLLIASAVYGLCYPNCDTAIRYAISHFVPFGPLRDKAFTWDSLSLDIGYTFAPTITAFLTNSVHPTWSVLVAIGGISIATMLFLSQRPIRSLDNISAMAEGRNYLAPPLMWVIIVSQFIFLAAIGAVELMVQDAGEAMHKGTWVGIILGIWSIFSVMGGLLLEHYYTPRNKILTLGITMLAMGIALVPLAFFMYMSDAVRIGGMLVFISLSGIPFAYSIGLSFSLLDDLFPAQTPAKYFAWMGTAPALGYAFGLLGAGKIAQQYGPYMQMSISGGLILIIGGVFLLRYLWRQTIPQAQEILSESFPPHSV